MHFPLSDILLLYIVVMDAACLIRYKKLILNEWGDFYISLPLAKPFTPSQALPSALTVTVHNPQVLTLKGVGFAGGAGKLLAKQSHHFDSDKPPLK